TLGLGTTDHAVPFQDSTRVLWVVCMKWKPMAVHELVEMQETPARELISVPTLGLGTIDQAVPFQDSTRVPLPAWPTVVHELAETQDTPLRKFHTDLTFGLGTTDHLVPFQDSIRVLLPLVLVMNEPTAWQELGEMQDTPERPSVLVPGVELGTIDQAVPFQDSISVWLALPLE